MQFLQQGIVAIFKFLELVWTWSFGEIIAIFHSDWKALPIWKLVVLVAVVAAIAYVLYKTVMVLWEAAVAVFGGVCRAAQRFRLRVALHRCGRADRLRRRLGHPQRELLARLEPNAAAIDRGEHAPTACQEVDRNPAGRGAGDRGPGPRHPRRRAAQAHADGDEPARARHRRHHRCRHLRADGTRRGGERRAGDRPLVHPRRHRLRVRGAMLRRDGLHRSDLGQRLHVRVCDDGRAHRLDHRLGPHPRVCARRHHRRDRLVGLCRELPERYRHPPARSLRKFAARLRSRDRRLGDDGRAAQRAGRGGRRRHIRAAGRRRA